MTGLVSGLALRLRHDRLLRDPEATWSRTELRSEVQAHNDDLAEELGLR